MAVAGVFDEAEAAGLRAAPSRWAWWLLLLAGALAGLAAALILPPLEGFDEIAHWSSLQQVADTGRDPRYGIDTVSTDLFRYRGPIPYGAPGLPAPTETYQAYRHAGAPALVMHAGVYGRSRPGGGFRNWEAQHPPLYYRLLAPLFAATRGLLLRDQVLALRLASWSLALCGLLVAALGARRWLADGARVALVIAGWPLLVPMVLPEMVRMGNDSLCLLVSGCAFAALMSLVSEKAGRGRWASAGALGVLLGLGLLTKALFLPIVAGTGLLLLLRWGRERTLARAGELLLVVGLALSIGLWWYLARYLETGSFSGSDEFVQFHRAGGGSFLQNLAQRFSWPQLLVGLANIVVGFIWGGTWSLAQPHSYLLLAPALVIAVPLFNWLRSWRTLGWSDLAALLWIAPLAASLVYHVLMLIAFTGVGAGTPGHYLHILAPAFALGVARGWRWRWTGLLMLAATGVFTAYIWSQQLGLYSGCAGKDAVTNHYLFDQGCFIDGHSLSALGHPVAAAVALGLALLCLVAAGVSLRHALRPKAESVLRPIEFAASAA